MSFSIQGKVALVTGAASGIGLAIATELLKNGVKGVLIIDINADNGEIIVENLRKTYGQSKCVFKQCDVSQPKQLEDAFEFAIETFKQLDIVVNNAGIVGEDIWQKLVAVNLCGYIAGTKLAIEKYLPQYKSAKEAVIVNVASICGLEAHSALPVYSATKFGIVGLSQAYGSSSVYEKTNIKVLIVCPSSVGTPLLYAMEVTAEEEAVITIQSPDHIGKNVIGIIQNGTTGSTWVIRDNKPAYEETFLKRDYYDYL